MAEFKNLYRACLRATSTCLRADLTGSGPSEQIITIQPKAKIKPSPFQVQPCEVVKIVVENTAHKPQPMNV